MIYVTGDMIIDEYLYGNTTRISPEAPVPIVDLERREKRLGGCGNVFNNVLSIYKSARLGCYLDKQHHDLVNVFDDTYIIIDTVKVPVKTRVISNGRYMSRIDDEQYIKDNTLQQRIEKLNLKPHDVLILSDYNKGSIKDPQSIINNTKAKVLVDPKLKLDAYKGAYLVKPNKKEFEDYAGKCNSAKELMNKAQLTRDHLELTYLVVTLGEDGVLLVGDSVEYYPTIAKEVVDVTGAGDVFMSVLALAVHSGRTISESTRMANRLAGKSVTIPGTYTITKRDWILVNEDLNNRT